MDEKRPVASSGISPSPRVCISVLNWNSADHTLACVQALAQLDYPNYEVLVVDNASGDDSVQRIHAALPDVRVLVANTNLGYAGGNQLALEAALAEPDVELFWILNNDSLVAPNTLQVMVEAYQQYGLAVYGGVPLHKDRYPWQIARMTRWKNLKGSSLLYHTRFNNQLYTACFPSTEPQVVNHLHGSTLLIPLEVVRRYGFLDTDLFLYGEETDYGLRLKRQGIPSILVPESVIFHTMGGSSGGVLSAVLQYYGTRNLLVVYRRYAGFLPSIGLTVVTLLKLVRNMLRRGVSRSEAPYILLGIRDSFLGRLGKTFEPEDYRQSTK